MGKEVGFKASGVGGAPVMGHDRVTGVPLCSHGEDAAACQLSHREPGTDAISLDRVLTEDGCFRVGGPANGGSVTWNPTREIVTAAHPGAVWLHSLWPAAAADAAEFLKHGGEEPVWVHLEDIHRAITKLAGPDPVPGVREIQQLTWRNKLAKGFNTTDVPLEFCYLQAEVAEAFDAWRKGRDNLGEELADVALFLVSLAEMNGVDLLSEIVRKLAKNADRQYVTGPAGLPVQARLT